MTHSVVVKWVITTDDSLCGGEVSHKVLVPLLTESEPVGEVEDHAENDHEQANAFRSPPPPVVEMTS